jgi:2-C-methyl-D-erythritol 4-phosphate cytidylyltransferase/2-C-methyl-D-erythritol 2,4-cyclodiphosphate synthase
MSFCLILLAAGNSNRFNSNLAKPYHKIGEKTLLEISLNKSSLFSQIKNTIVVYNKKHQRSLKRVNLKNVKFIKGGKTRQESTFNALKYLTKQKGISKVLIHDSARPNFSSKLLGSIIKNMKKSRVVVPTLKINDAIKQKQQKYIMGKSRNDLFVTQTPQCFNLKEIYNLHKLYKHRYLDDDLSLLKNFNKVKLIEGEKNNFKITDKSDFENLKNIYKSKMNVGIGFDVHRLVPKRKLYLGGLRIKSKLGTLGHSDGDPVLHSVTDSILGACKMGDIGQMFSDKSKKFKNIRSTILLKKVINQIKSKGYYINNLDINIITQTPKISKFKKKMTKLISDICEIQKNQINIKGKTTEKLGLIGKEKAIACEVITSVIKYD